MALAADHPASAFQAVSDPTRLRLLRLLLQAEMNVQEMVRILGMSQPGVSRHLAVLRDAGWLRLRKEGTWSWYAAVGRDELPGGTDLHAVVSRQAATVPEAAADDAALADVLSARDRRTGDFFDGIAAVWDRIRPAFEHPDVQAGALAALAPRGLEVVDIGTGTGALLPLLALAGARVTAVDSSPAMLERARDLCRREGVAQVEFRRADIQELPFTDDRFDAAYSSMVLHHVARPARALREMARVVRPGGVVVIMAFTSHRQTWMREKLAHQWLGFSRDEVEEFFPRYGLTLRSYLVRGLTGAAARAVLPPDLAGREVVWPDVFLAVGEKAGNDEASERGPAGSHNRPEEEQT